MTCPEPDGQGSHWLKVDKALLEAAGVQLGDTMALEFCAIGEAAQAKAAARPAHRPGRASRRKDHYDITPVARRDWIQWTTSGKKAETRVKRIATACDQLASGKRRACCSDRSGMYSRGNLGPPAAAD